MIVNRPVNPVPASAVTLYVRELATRPTPIPIEVLESLATEDATYVSFERTVAKLP
jgi:hypothetical protein